MTRKTLQIKSIQASELESYLTVYNRYTGNIIGNIGGISSNSLMLMTPWMVEVGSIFCFQVILSKSINGQTEIQFDAKCQWCHPDLDPQCFDSGYTMTWCDTQFENFRSILKNYLSFPLGW
ncbi:MAG: hypothetical protein HAW62_03430 [Endozoicomonadaceae bacterium]|nr:hypothetical protein [Endozoicomonadaceae bacterium]